MLGTSLDHISSERSDLVTRLKCSYIDNKGTKAELIPQKFSDSTPLDHNQNHKPDEEDYIML